VLLAIDELKPELGVLYAHVVDQRVSCAEPESKLEDADSDGDEQTPD
jgi:hypothetical protein